MLQVKRVFDCDFLLPIRGLHSGLSFSSCFYLLYPPPSLQPPPCPLSPHPWTSFWLSLFHLSWQLHPQHPSPIIRILYSSLLFRTLHYFELRSSTFATISPRIFTVPLPLSSHSHICILSFSYWLSSLFSPKHISSSPVSLLYQFLALATDHNIVIGKHHGPWSFLSDLIRHPIHHHCKQTRTQSRSLMQPHLHLEPLRHSYRTPNRCCTVIIHILYYSHVLLCHSRISHAIPHLFPWHLVICFLQVHKHTMLFDCDRCSISISLETFDRVFDEFMFVQMDTKSDAF